MNLDWRSLNLLSTVKVVLNLLWGGSQRIEGEKMVGNVVMETLAVEEDVMVIVVVLEALGGLVRRGCGDVGYVKDTRMAQRKLDLRSGSHNGCCRKGASVRTPYRWQKNER